MQRCNVVQHELVPMLMDEVGALTPKLEKVIYTLEWVRIDEFTGSSWLAKRVHEALINAHLGNELIGHLSRDGAAIVAQEPPATRSASVESESSPRLGETNDKWKPPLSKRPPRKPRR